VDVTWAENELGMLRNESSFWENFRRVLLWKGVSDE